MTVVAEQAEQTRKVSVRGDVKFAKADTNMIRELVFIQFQCAQLELNAFDVLTGVLSENLLILTGTN